MFSTARRWVHLIGMAILVFTASPSRAEGHPDFTGVWHLDLDASESLNGVLEAQGRSWAERKLADQVAPTQTVAQSPETLIIDIDMMVKHTRDVLHLNGQWETLDGKDAGEMTFRTFWSDDGQKLISESKMVFANGEPGMMFSTRSLSPDGKTTYLLLELKQDDGTYARSMRVLRKVEND